MLEKLQAIARRLDQVERQLSDPSVYADRESLTRLSREQKELTLSLIHISWKRRWRFRRCPPESPAPLPWPGDWRCSSRR